MRPVRLLVDGSVVTERNALLAVGYDRGVDVSTNVNGHSLTAAIRVVPGRIRNPYQYSLLVDGVPTADSEPVASVTQQSGGSIVAGIVETIAWVSLLSAAAPFLANGDVLRAVLLVPGAVLASLVLRRRGLPTSWRIAGAILVVAMWVLLVPSLLGFGRAPGGL